MKFSAAQFRADMHYCKFCDRDFRVKFEDNESGDFFLACPNCGKDHYHRIENGVAVHCELKNRSGDPIRIKGK